MALTPSYHEATRLNPVYAEAHCNLGLILRATGRYSEAVVALRHGHELGSKKADWPYPSAEWLQQAEHSAALAGRLPALLRGDDRPSDAAEGLEFATMAYNARHYAAAVRLYSEALEAEPKRAEDRQAQHRYNAACDAALAATGQGDDPPPDEVSRAALRRRALNWLRAERAAWAEQLESSPQARPDISQALRHWLADPDLASVRAESALGRLPEVERSAWRGLWDDVNQLATRAEAASP